MFQIGSPASVEQTKEPPHTVSGEISADGTFTRSPTVADSQTFVFLCKENELDIKNDDELCSSEDQENRTQDKRNTSLMEEGQLPFGVKAETMEAIPQSSRTECNGSDWQREGVRGDSDNAVQESETWKSIPLQLDGEPVGGESHQRLQQSKDGPTSGACDVLSTQISRDRQRSVDRKKMNGESDVLEPAVNDGTTGHRKVRSQDGFDTPGARPPNTPKNTEMSLGKGISRGSRKLPSLANILQPPRSSPGTVDRATVLANGVTITPSAPLSAVTAHHASGHPDKINFLSSTGGGSDVNPGPSTAVLHAEALLPGSRTQPGSKTPSVSGNSNFRINTTTRPPNTFTCASPSTSPTTAANKAFASTFISMAPSATPSSRHHLPFHSHQHTKSSENGHRSPKPRHDDEHHPAPNTVIPPHPPVSRTQQKILLQKQHFLTDDENSILHPQNHVHLTKESERISREYQCLRMFEDPMGDAIRRVSNARKLQNVSFGTQGDGTVAGGNAKNGSVRRQDQASLQGHVGGGKNSVSPGFQRAFSPSGTQTGSGSTNPSDSSSGTTNFFSRMIWGTRDQLNSSNEGKQIGNGR